MASAVPFGEAWKARIAQLIKWAVAEEKGDGDIHFGLSCYCEAIFMVHRALTSAASPAPPGLLASVKPVLESWTDRALLLQAIIVEENVPPSSHPLLRALPPPHEEDTSDVTEMWDSKSPDPLLLDKSRSPHTVPTEQPMGPRRAAEILDLPLPPTFKDPDQLPLPPVPPEEEGEGDIDDDEFAKVYARFVKLQDEGDTKESSRPATPKP